MTRSSHHILTAALAFVLVATPHVVSAQAVVQPLPGTTDADRLADTMRQLAANPRNVDALVRAGELSLGLGDLSGAAALFARAEKVDPRNGRMKAGMASILVRSERPGEALRYFAQAEAFGLQPRYFAADRGLAYDLIGQQDRAQRDYRVALRDAPDDETIRRYALSLGISGNRDLALKQLDPLVLKKDRGAWRARAFILAMNSDVKGAETIVTTMMPGAAAQGLLPFFQRLPTLTSADRAFAVHFGEVHTTPERIADARMTPPLPALGIDPTAPVMLAAVQPQATRAAPVVEKASGRRDRTTPGRVAMAATTPTVPTMAVARSVQPAGTTVAASSVAAVQPRALASVAPATTVAAVPSSPASTGTLPQSTVAQMAALQASSGGTPAGTPIVSRAGATLVATPSPVLAANGSSPTAQAAPGFTSTTPVPVVPTTPAPVQVAAVTTPPPAARAMAASEDTILARIIAGLSIPASELGVAPPVRATPVAAVPAADDGARVLAEAKAKADRDAAAEKIAAEKVAAEKVVADAKLARAKLAADKKIADRKALADKKALAEKKAAAAAKLLADKEAAEEKRIARANPERIWVQVSTGATEGDLPKAWKGAKAKAPAAFGSRGGWTTPWKATNRVLAGPFKTQAEARTFVNALAKEGVSTFSFTSDPGQIITKLPSK